MPQPIRLLHLSDIHFRAGTDWDADPVLRALRAFIAAEIKAGLAPDLVVITGDLAHAGTADDYAPARRGAGWTPCGRH
jgi:3',5'-cyclic AMP phosphodiesterase CpdA